MISGSCQNTLEVFFSLPEMRINKKDKKEFIFSLYGHKQHKVLLHMLNCVRNISLGL